MTLAPPRLFKPLFQRTAVALAMVAGCASASALPVFTFDPTPLLTSTERMVTADNILISDFAKVVINGTSFTEYGYLAVTGFQLGGEQVTNTGLNTDYGMYVRFDGTGTITSPNTNPVADFTYGRFDTLTYTLYGYTGPGATFSIVGNEPTENANGEIVLARGELINGTVSTSPNNGDRFAPKADAKVTFNVADTAGSFFNSPDPFYNIAFATFSNTPSQVTVFAGGFNISQGGGAINFAAPIPEPETYALMLAGLAAVGFVARRRRPID